MRQLKSTLGAAAIALIAGAANAQEVTLNLHQFLPATSVVPADILYVWADKIEAESGGRIKVERFASMALGGAPQELMDQAIDGVADIIWTAVGYTPGRFPSTEVFELPFIVEDAAAASCAFWTMFDDQMRDEFADVRVLGTWVHGPGLFHTADPVKVPADLAGMKIRGGSRLVNQLLERTGATPVGMPVPGVPEALSKGVIDGATLPWEVTDTIKVAELIENHTEFEGSALYNLTFVMVMNNDAYDAMPADLQAIIDDNSGLNFSVFAGTTQQAADAPGRAIAEELGNSIVTIDAETSASDWRPIVQPIYAEWVADMAALDKDGQAMVDEARGLMAGSCAGALSDF